MFAIHAESYPPEGKSRFFKLFFFIHVDPLFLGTLFLQARIIWYCSVISTYFLA